MVNTGHPLRRLRNFLLLEAGLLLAASLVHSGWLLQGYDHSRARIAEAVIAAVLLAAWTASFAWPAHTRKLALLAQAAALKGTLVGVFVIIVGIGPQSAPDVVFHLALVVLLFAGLRFALRASRVHA